MCILGCNAVGDEQHYLIDCLHLGIRELIFPLLSKINLLRNGFKEMSSREKTVFILSRSNEEMLKVRGVTSHGKKFESSRVEFES